MRSDSSMRSTLMGCPLLRHHSRLECGQSSPLQVSELVHLSAPPRVNPCTCLQNYPLHFYVRHSGSLPLHAPNLRYAPRSRTDDLVQSSDDKLDFSSCRLAQPVADALRREHTHLADLDPGRARECRRVEW